MPRMLESYYTDFSSAYSQSSPPSETYLTALDALGNGASFMYLLESGSSSAEMTGNGAGSLSYTASPTYVGPAGTGVAGGLRFNGTDQFASTAHHSSFNFGTNDFWLHILFNIDNAGWPASGENEMMAHGGNNDYGEWGISATSVDVTPRVRLEFFDTSANGGANTMYLDSMPGSGWHQMVFTVDRDSATGVKLYVDGSLTTITRDPTAAQGNIDYSSTFWVAKRTTLRFLAMDLALPAGGTGLPTSGDISSLWALL